MMREMQINAGEGDGELTIVITGPDCVCQDLQMLLTAYAKELIKDAKARRAKTKDRKPCGCKDAD